MSGPWPTSTNPERTFAERFNPEMVDAEPLDADDQDWLRDFIAEHGRETGSPLAERLVDDWKRTALDFVKVMPRDYRRVLEATRLAEGRGTIGRRRGHGGGTWVSRPDSLGTRGSCRGVGPSR